jgi:hypothetical protein
MLKSPQSSPFINPEMSFFVRAKKVEVIQAERELVAIGCDTMSGTLA